MNRLLTSRLFLFLLTAFVLLGSATAALAQTIVEPLPDNNLIENPWFRDGNKSSLAGWTDAAGSNVIWSLSQKQSNPSADAVMGTSARLAFGSGQGGGTGQGGVDAYLYQVVAADSALNHLQFKVHWVTQWIDRATVTIYGGGSANGPWTAVWTPLDVDQSSSSGGAWTQTELLDTTIAEGFPYYKVELFGRYPDGRQQGAKYTGVYFAVDGNAGEVSTPAAEEPTATMSTTEPAPTIVPAEETAVLPTNTPIPALDETPEPETAVSDQAVAANTPEPEATNRPARPVQTTRPGPRPDTPDNATTTNDSISGVYLVIIGVLLLLVIVLGIGWLRATRR